MTAVSGAETPQSQFVFYERPCSHGEHKGEGTGQCSWKMVRRQFRGEVRAAGSTQLVEDEKKKCSWV